MAPGTDQEAMMPERGDEPQSTDIDPTLEGSQEDERLLDDLDPEEEAAAGVEGGARATARRWGRA
jgi:hypothetical protein